ncbi:MAG TPA: hypothetical protein VJ483_07390 [Holophagaceae bacterium]|nr:hypothetical protein [Holophagaceae bacterium]
MTFRAAFRLFASLILVPVLGCGGGGGGSSSGGSTPPPPVSVSVTSTSTAATPTVTTNGTLTFTATVSNATNTTVSWSVQEGAAGGTITSGGVYTAPGVSGTYHVIATPAADPSKAKTTAVTVVVPPAITSFTAAKGTVTAGSGTLLTAVFSGGTGSVDHALGTVTSGAAKNTGNLAATTVFTLTVTNAAGDAVTAQATVTVVAAPAITSFTATPNAIGSGSTTSLTGVFTGGAGVVDQGIGAVTSGVAKVSAALGATTTFTLTVTNAAADSVTATATVTVITAPPTITTFTASPTTITQGHNSTLAWTVTGQAVSSVTIDQGVGAVALSGNTAVSPASPTTYTLTATNLKGTVTATASVAVVFPPSIASFTASPTTVTPGSASSVTPVFSQGTGAIDQGIGAVASGTAYSTGALPADKTYTLTVTNSAGDSVTKTLTVHVDPGTFTATGNLNTPRSFALSVPLPDGRVLILGGNSGATTAEFFDPAGNAGAGTFTLAAGALSQRISFGAMLLANGKVLVVGGALGTTVLPDLQLFDPATGAFTSSAHALSVPRSAPWVALLRDGRVLIAGGYNYNGAGGTFQSLNSSEIYDPVSDNVTPTGDLGVAQSTGYAVVMPALTLSNNTVLIAGGGNSSGNADCEIYDVAAGTWAPGPPALSLNWITETLLPDGRALFASSGVSGNNCALYDPATGLATTTGTLLQPSYSSPSLTVMGDGRVLYAGDAGAPGFEVPADAQLFDPATGTWKSTGNPGDRGEQAAALLPSGKVLLAGGFDYGATGVLNTAVLFDAGPAVASPTPSASITTASSAVTGTAGHTASVPAVAGARYVWMIQGGTITGGLGTNSVTYTAGAPGSLTLDCLVVSAVGMPGQGSASVTVTP